MEKSIRDMGLGQWDEFSVALDKAGFKPDDIQKIITAKKNKLAVAMCQAYLAESGQTEIDERYSLINTFQFTVPDNYDHEHQLAVFSQENKAKFYDYNDDITDANFAKVTNKLIPGKTYTAKFFQINQDVSSEDSLSFLKSQSAILVGAQGLSLVKQLKADEFPVGRWTLSFDEEEALWRDAADNLRIPGLNRGSGGRWNFGLGGFKNDWYSGRCLLCVCDLPLEA